MCDTALLEKTCCSLTLKYFRFFVFVFFLVIFGNVVFGQVVLNVSLALATTTTSINGGIPIIGTVNMSNGTLAANTSIFVLINGTIQFDTGDAHDGTLNVTTSGHIINNYTFVTINLTNGTQMINVTTTSGFSDGDEILIIQAQGGSTGVYEFKKNITVDGTNRINLSSGLVNSYLSNTGSNTTQVIRVPHFSTVTVQKSGRLTATAWNGSIGGIIAFRAQEGVVVNGSIDATGVGYRGGTGRSGSNGDQGESINGLGAAGVTSVNDGGGGAATGRNNGGGGGYGTAGTSQDSARGGTPGSGGNTYGDAEVRKFFLGSGGGGSTNNPTFYGGTNTGTNGGGIIVIAARNITILGNITAQSNQGAISTGCDCLLGGTGSGGTIYLIAELINITTTGNVTAKAGVPGRSNFGRGVNGGEGRIRLDFMTLTAEASPRQGYNSTIISATTDVFGNYSFLVVGPRNAGNYLLLVNTTFKNNSSEATATFQVQSADTAPPTWSTNTTNFTVISENNNGLFNVTWTDNVALSGYIFSMNDSGAWVNESFTKFSGTTNVSNVAHTVNNTKKNGEVIGWRVYANDTSNNWNQTSIFTFVITGSAPQWSSNATNFTRIGQYQVGIFNSSWTENYQLSGFIFSINDSGSWVNSTFQRFSGISNVSSNTSIINAAAGSIVGWRFYANDTSNNWNATPIFTFRVNNPPSGIVPAQTFSGKSYTIDLADYITDSDRDALTYAVSLTNKISVSISGSRAIFASDSSATGTATVTATDGIDIFTQGVDVTARVSEPRNAVASNIMAVIAIADKTGESIAGAASKTWGGVVAGAEMQMQISNRQIPITTIVIPVINYLNKPVFTVKSFNEKPQVIKSFEGIPYQYVAISKTNAADNDLGDARVDFTVKGTWLAEHNVNPQAITLYHWVNNAWEKLVTTFSGSEKGDYHYKTSTHSFSYFVIGADNVTAKGAEEKLVEEKKSPEKTTEPEKIASPEKSDKEQIPDKEQILIQKTEETLSGKQSNLLVYWLVLLVVLAGLSYPLWKRMLCPYKKKR